MRRHLAVALLLATACHANAPTARPAPTSATPSTTSPSPGPAPTPTVSLGPDGLVVIRDAKGEVVAESHCQDGEYGPSVRLMTALRNALRAGDREAVTHLMWFPISWKGRTTGRAEFERRYDEIFSRGVVAKITSVDPHAIVCRNGEFMIDDGIVWGAGDTNGHYLVVTVNEPF